METEEIENDEWYVIKMEHPWVGTYYIDQDGQQCSTPHSGIGVGTIADAKEVFANLKGNGKLPMSDAEYSIEKVEEVFKVSYALNLEL